MARRLVACSFVLAVMGCTIPAAFAQDNLLDDLYGRGVHAYFSHEYQDAYSLLSDAIKSGSRDPRAYYFRGLTFARLGRPEEAKADIKMGSELEASGDTPVKVGRALERVQGPERLLIESSRKSARLAIRNAAEERAKVRYGERVRAEAAVLRDPTKPAVGPAPVPTAPTKDDPFNEGGKPAELPATPDDAKPAAEPPPAAEEKPAETKPPADDPFGEAKPAEEKPAAAPGGAPAAATEAGKGTVLSSLFRAVGKAIPSNAPAPAAAPKPAVQPAGLEVEPAIETTVEEKPATEDPFGAEAPKPVDPKAPEAAPAEPKPADPKPAAEDPFAEPAAKPAEPKPPAAEDPFQDDAPADAPAKPAEPKAPPADDPFGS